MSVLLCTHTDKCSQILGFPPLNIEIAGISKCNLPVVLETKVKLQEELFPWRKHNKVINVYYKINKEVFESNKRLVQ